MNQSMMDVTFDAKQVDELYDIKVSVVNMNGHSRSNWLDLEFDNDV